MPFLPIDKSEIKGQLDIIIVTGDAYIDHPSFGPVVIARNLEAHGFSVGIIAQPNWKEDKDFLKLGKPRIFFGIAAGNLDSMVANYTADNKIRRTDMYTPDNKGGKRPDRATIVYTNKIKQLFPDSMVILGGVEASLRRFAHYDYWSNKVRRSILFDSKADLIVYGMGENAIVEVANVRGQNLELLHLSNTAIILKDISQLKEYLILPSFEEVSTDKKKYVEAFKLYYLEGRKRYPRIIVQPCQGRYLVVFPPQVMTSHELETVFKLPYMYEAHPSYKDHKIPAWDFVKFSTISHRGCFGGCSFCAISQHQGKYIVSRSQKSIEDEVKNIIMKRKDFRGTILDIGGPTANMYMMECSKKEGCTRASCIYPAICPHLKNSHKPLINLLKSVRNIPGVKHLFSNSGIRYDLAMQDPEYIKELVEHHVSGQLSVAPEHVCEEVLLTMGKPGVEKFESFKKEFDKISKQSEKKQYLIPYFIASHPGATLEHALKLALFLKKNHMKIEQVQNFTPTPMTVSTCMYYTGIDPFTGKQVYVPKGEERTFQRALLQPYLQKNKREIIKALTNLGKRDLIQILLE
ncbi:YgiQ family radical SAM protein [candidate division WOR-1 bacterium RIFOXYA2_FULL_36_21]|uniref:YgiQ family radical SAM protein n=1 Tax=candidate division WOR-1 bacterium RIFOXYB2_FULL_36_35 TaxID=1802578 RepID=A0A1F4S473_UNCSA|nr:MAG: YgiQ family radical SAM protein [candidate division WOR-1 bacterium RIFOXYA2_FULL_36_21]OGC14230.1 MAG: YgiQ family radical SAM protein [candidate division WOR-1 bacterium RIFOXYA12_FULL_36_13]OGC15235.1 MAG: YgiQ family radical SAM protein [candidate division WOR-1 bacterium RIFOXYB2_FULL_36_35]